MVFTPPFHLSRACKLLIFPVFITSTINIHSSSKLFTIDNGKRIASKPRGRFRTNRKRKAEPI